MVRQKYELEEHEDRFERLKTVINEIHHDVKSPSKTVNINL